MSTTGTLIVDPGTRSVLSLARSVLGELDVDVVIERVLGASRDLTDAKYAALGVLDETRTSWRDSSRWASMRPHDV